MSTCIKNMHIGRFKREGKVKHIKRREMATCRGTIATMVQPRLAKMNPAKGVGSFEAVGGCQAGTSYDLSKARLEKGLVIWSIG